MFKNKKEFPFHHLLCKGNSIVELSTFTAISTSASTAMRE